MLDVAVQLPAAVLADEASGAAAIASTTQMADAAAFRLTMWLPLFSPRWTGRAYGAKVASALQEA
jgi:hypothetical protein